MCPCCLLASLCVCKLASVPVVSQSHRVPLFPVGSSSALASSAIGANFISKMLLANADALCAAVSPLMTDDITL